MAGRSVQNKVDRGEHFISEKQSVSSSLVEAKSVVVQDLQGKYETSRTTSPQEEEAKSSRESSVERHVLPSSALVDKIIKRAKISSFGKFISVLLGTTYSGYFSNEHNFLLVLR